MTKPILAVTMGDAAGIGPEIILKVLAGERVHRWSRPLIVGSEDILRRDLGLVDDATITVRRVEEVGDAVFSPGIVNVIDPGVDLSDVRYGELSPQAGRGSVEFVRRAVDLAKQRAVDAVVTAPLNKAAMHQGGHRYPGHTELLAELYGVSDFSLVLAARDLYVFHVTTHIALREACDLITPSSVYERIMLMHRFAKAVGRADDTIAVLGLNPHAGESGMFGAEDDEAIRPAVEKARDEGVSVEGPLPGDTSFPAAFKGAYHFVLAMYHDQGHIPFKSVYLDEGVNITVGLPVVRTSVDHGTAFDIAGQGVARESSLIEAMELAATLAPEWEGVWERMRE